MASTTILSDNGVSSGSAGIKTTGGNDGVLALQTTTSGGTATTAVTIDTSQNVGVKVVPSAWRSTNPALQIGQTASLYGYSASTIAGLGSNLFINSAGDEKYIADGYATLYQQNNSGQHRWYNAASGTAGNTISFTQAMTLDSSGNLLVGTTSAAVSARLTSSFLSSSSIYGSVFIDSQSNNTAIFAQFRNGSGALGSITNNNNSAVAYNTSSDYRLKENIAPMTGALDKVAQLKPCTYTWKATNENSQGFIAHELQEVVPDCVTGEKDAVDADGNPVYQGIDTSFLVATLTAAIQELKAELDAAKADIATLKGAA